MHGFKCLNYVTFVLLIDAFVLNKYGTILSWSIYTIISEMDYNYPVYSVKMEGVNEETQNELLKQTYAPLLFLRKSVRLFSMSDDEFYL